MSVTGLLIFMAVSIIIWVLGGIMQWLDKPARTFKPTPPHWWERDIETFIRKYWVWIVLFLIWLGMFYIALIISLTHAIAIHHGIPKPLP